MTIEFIGMIRHREASEITIVRVGTEEWRRQGPNQRMVPARRAACRHFR
ncbi:MAG TPA: hypothetical protein VMQ99_06080 [Acetobacteraceae bacterium]|jgi:hypothetical protein|nr:hypothetical protein [Acetobacteraceae bacterium]